MSSGPDLASPLLIVAIVAIAFVALDLLLAGGGMTGGMMRGIGGMKGTPWWWGLLVALAAVVALLALGRGSG